MKGKDLGALTLQDGTLLNGGIAARLYGRIHSVIKPATPVNGEKLPKWLRTEIMSHAKTLRRGAYRRSRNSVSLAFWSEATRGHGWIDHWGTTTGRTWMCDEVFVSEPYGFGPDDAKQLDAFCATYKCKWTICAHSAHYPTACIRIYVYRDKVQLP